jgi:hypothetical protein
MTREKRGCMWFHVLYLFSVMHIIRIMGRSVLELTAKTSHAATRVLRKILGSLRKIFIKLVRVCLS